MENLSNVSKQSRSTKDIVDPVEVSTSEDNVVYKDQLPPTVGENLSKVKDAVGGLFSSLKNAVLTEKVDVDEANQDAYRTPARERVEVKKRFTPKDKRKLMAAAFVAAVAPFAAPAADYVEEKLVELTTPKRFDSFKKKDLELIAKAHNIPVSWEHCNTGLPGVCAYGITTSTNSDIEKLCKIGCYTPGPVHKGCENYNCEGIKVIETTAPNPKDSVTGHAGMKEASNFYFDVELVD